MTYGRAIDESPFYILYGRDPVIPMDLFLPVNKNNLRQSEADDIYAYKFEQLKKLREAYEKLNVHREHERDYVKQQYNKTHKPVCYQKGDLVWIYREAQTKSTGTNSGISASLLPDWKGPFKVSNYINPVNYRVESLDQKTSFVSHVSNMKRYQPWTPAV